MVSSTSADLNDVALNARKVGDTIIFFPTSSRAADLVNCVRSILEKKRQRKRKNVYSEIKTVKSTEVLEHRYSALAPIISVIILS